MSPLFIVARFDFECKNFKELLKKYGMLDAEDGHKVTGRNFAYLKNDAVLLEFALNSWAMEFAEARGYASLIVPNMCKRQIAKCCGVLSSDSASILTYHF